MEFDKKFIEEIFQTPHEKTIEKLREFVNSQQTYTENEKILYIFFITITGEVGVEPFIKDEEHKCFTPIHDDFLMSGERFLWIAIDHDFVIDVVTQDLINDDVLLPEEVAQMLISQRDKADAEFINLINETWNGPKSPMLNFLDGYLSIRKKDDDNDISECL